MSDSKPGLDFTALRVGLKWLVGSPIMIALGISQGVTGWIGEPLWMRIIYPLILVPIGLLIGWLGYLLLVNEIFGLPQVSEDALPPETPSPTTPEPEMANTATCRDLHAPPKNMGKEFRDVRSI